MYYFQLTQFHDYTVFKANFISIEKKRVNMKIYVNIAMLGFGIFDISQLTVFRIFINNVVVLQQIASRPGLHTG